jgi:hypothetical protein
MLAGSIGRASWPGSRPRGHSFLRRIEPAAVVRRVRTCTHQPLRFGACEHAPYGLHRNRGKTVLGQVSVPPAIAGTPNGASHIRWLSPRPSSLRLDAPEGGRASVPDLSSQHIPDGRVGRACETHQRTGERWVSLRSTHPKSLTCRRWPMKGTKIIDSQSVPTLESEAMRWKRTCDNRQTGTGTF